MARPKSDDKRNAILAAATRIIVAQGLSAPTAVIAQAAGVANGTLFTYFETKSDLLNQLYLELKSEMASTALADLRPNLTLRNRFYRVWTNWAKWTLASPEKRRTLALLGVSDQITPATRATAHKFMTPFAELIEQSRAHGPLSKSPMSFVTALMNSIADATMDYMIQDPSNAETHCKQGFDALWRILS